MTISQLRQTIVKESCGFFIDNNFINFIERKLNYGDYYYRTGNVLRDAGHNGPEDIRISSLSVSHYDGIEKSQSVTILPNQTHEDTRSIWIDIATIIGRKRNACKYREEEMIVEKIDI